MMYKVLGILSLSFILISQLTAKDKPNIIFIMADDLGIGDLSSHGAKATPQLNLAVIPPSN